MLIIRLLESKKKAIIQGRVVNQFLGNNFNICVLLILANNEMELQSLIFSRSFRRKFITTHKTIPQNFPTKRLLYSKTV